MRCIIRPLLFIQSCFYVLLGIGLLAWSIVYGLEQFAQWNGRELEWIAVANISAGGVILVFGLLGYVTSCLSSYSFAYFYSILILVFVIIQCIFGIIVVIFRYEIEKVIIAAMQESMKGYSFHNEGVYHTLLRTVWDYAQQYLQCCGVNGPSDWEREEQNVPVSCEVFTNSTTLTSSEKLFYDVGCIDMAASYLSEHVIIVIIVSCAIMVFQIMGVCLSCCLARSVQVEHWEEY